MIAGSETLVGLKSRKTQLEVGLICLRRKRAEMVKRRSKLADQSDDYEISARLAALDDEIAAFGVEVARAEKAIREVDVQIDRTSRQAVDEGLQELLVANAGMSDELEALRVEMLRSLRQLAEPLRRYQEVADRKGRLVRKLANHGKDLSYQNYLDCSLLRQTDVDDDLRFVVEAIKHLRVVA